MSPPLPLALCTEIKTLTPIFKRCCRPKTLVNNNSTLPLTMILLRFDFLMRRGVVPLLLGLIHGGEEAKGIVLKVFKTG